MGQQSVKTAEIFYPESDGKPMAETEFHLKLMSAVIHALRQ